jgi:hypothetical protein
VSWPFVGSQLGPITFHSFSFWAVLGSCDYFMPGFLLSHTEEERASMF